MTGSQMNIRQAARWAERKGILRRVDRHGQPDYLYAVYSLSNHAVVCIGYYDKCRAQMADGLKMVALDEVCEQMDESDGESSCAPDLCEQREWA